MLCPADCQPSAALSATLRHVRAIPRVTGPGGILRAAAGILALSAGILRPIAPSVRLVCTV